MNRLKCLICKIIRSPFGKALRLQRKEIKMNKGAEPIIIRPRFFHQTSAKPEKIKNGTITSIGGEVQARKPMLPAHRRKSIMEFFLNNLVCDQITSVTPKTKTVAG